MFTCEKWFTGYNFGIENGVNQNLAQMKNSSSLKF